jgi:hypothetical protein
MALATAGGGVGEFCGGKFGLPPRAEVPNTIPAAIMIEANIQRMVSVLILSSLRYITYYESQPTNFIWFSATDFAKEDLRKGATARTLCVTSNYIE